MGIEISLILQLLLALILGAFIGLDREIKEKEAGLQTYSLVCLGSCVFTLVSIELFYYFAGNPEVSFSPIRIVQAVAVGIGFIGGGVIFKRSSDVEGLTTAAGLWVAAAVGVAVGIKLYSLAIIVASMVVIVLVVFGILERKLTFLKRRCKDNHRQK